MAKCSNFDRTYLCDRGITKENQKDTKHVLQQNHHSVCEESTLDPTLYKIFWRAQAMQLD